MRLPQLASGLAQIDLPLGDATAARWCAALVSDQFDDRRRLLSEALAVDPALALWTVACAWLRNRSSCLTLEHASRWLAERGSLHLTWPPGPQESAAADAPENGFADVAARSAALATLARRLATDSSPQDADAAQLLALLHSAIAWRSEQLGSAADSRDDLAVLLPPELVDGLTAIAGANATRRSGAAGFVAAAISIIAGKSRGKQAGQFDRAAHEALIAEHRAAWLANHGWAEALPALAAKLARLDRLESDFQATLRHEKLEAMKELAYGAGHEINNPLANISARAQTLLAEERDPERRRRLAAIHAQALRAHEMIADMMLFARPPQLTPRLTDLGELIKRVVAELSPMAARQVTELVFDSATSEALPAAVDPVQMAVATRALASNAMEAVGRGGIVKLCLRRAMANPEEFEIVVTDNGPGVAAEIGEKIFDPFFSGREAGRGIGFGLTKCWRIVVDHGGRIDVGVTPGGGATFTITAPIVSPLGEA